MKVYFISGLGADCRVFTHIRLPEGFEKVDIDWISPLKNESLGEYALRLAGKIDTSEKFAVVGLSMGGMIASEIAGRFSPAATILVSSISSSDQIPKRYKIMHALKLDKLLPVSVIKSATVLKRLFTVESKDDKSLLRAVIKDTDPVFIRWALRAIPQWHYTAVPKDLWHIHGSSDEILPIRYTRPTHTIAGGSHMMVMTKAIEVNKIIAEALATIR